MNYIINHTISGISLTLMSVFLFYCSVPPAEAPVQNTLARTIRENTDSLFSIINYHSGIQGIWRHISVKNAAEKQASFPCIMQSIEIEFLDSGRFNENSRLSPDDSLVFRSGLYKVDSNILTINGMDLLIQKLSKKELILLFNEKTGMAFDRFSK